MKTLGNQYKNILMQEPKKVTPKKMFVYFDINQRLKTINLKEKTEFIAGQYDDGGNIIYTSNNEISLNNTKISELRTFFISKNNRFDYSSNFRLVSGLFSKTHCISKVIEAFYYEKKKVLLVSNTNAAAERQKTVKIETAKIIFFQNKC